MPYAEVYLRTLWNVRGAVEGALEKYYDGHDHPTSFSYTYYTVGSEDASEKYITSLEVLREYQPDFKACVLVVDEQVYTDDDGPVNVFETLDSLGISEGYLVTVYYHW